MDRSVLIDNLLNFLLMEKLGQGTGMDLAPVAELFAKAGWGMSFSHDNTGLADEILKQEFEGADLWAPGDDANARRGG